MEGRDLREADNMVTSVWWGDKKGHQLLQQEVLSSHQTLKDNKRARFLLPYPNEHVLVYLG